MQIILLTQKKDNPIKAVMELTDKKGADAVIDFVNASKTVETDMQILRRRAKVVLVGLYGGELKLNLVTMPTRAYRLIGSYTGSLNDLNELVSLAKRKIIKPDFTISWYISTTWSKRVNTKKTDDIGCQG